MLVKREPAVMDQAGYQFLPPFLVAQAGQPIQFRNSEDVLHNVRVTEVEGDKPVFNVATIAFGTYEHKFERPGFYMVGCDIHSTMRADILITASPYTAKADEKGVFSVADVPPTVSSCPSSAPPPRFIGTLSCRRPPCPSADATDRK